MYFKPVRGVPMTQKWHTEGHFRDILVKIGSKMCYLTSESRVRLLLLYVESSVVFLGLDNRPKKHLGCILDLPGV